MCSLCLRYLVVSLGFDGMYEIRKLNGVLDEEDGYIVSHDICIMIIISILGRCYVRLTIVSFIRVETKTESMDISGSISASTRSSDGRKA